MLCAGIGGNPESLGPCNRPQLDRTEWAHGTADVGNDPTVDLLRQLDRVAAVS
jgi:hypothetical protein